MFGKFLMALILAVLACAAVAELVWGLISLGQTQNAPMMAVLGLAGYIAVWGLTIFLVRRQGGSQIAAH